MFLLDKLGEAASCTVKGHIKSRNETEVMDCATGRHHACEGAKKRILHLGMMRYVWYFVLFLSVIQNYIYNSSVYSLLVHHSTIGEHYLIMKVFDVVHHTTRTHSLCERGPSKATGRAAEAASVSSITVPWVAALPKR